ncbi:MAG TPA: ROK family protein [Elusimicrobia bacterium]|nr:ROK family protein [Elusimicrobiota bacterium]
MPKGLYVGVDVGGTKIAAALVDGKGRILLRDKTATPRDGKPKGVLKAISVLVKGLLNEGGLRRKDLLGVGAGVPGIVDGEGRMLAAPNVALAGVRVGRELEKALGADAVVGNDVNLGVLGEQWLGAARGHENVVGIFPGTGVGGGVIVGGELLLGTHGAAAELGHIVVDPEGPVCGCGIRGCLEALASRTAIEKDIRRALRRGERSLIRDWLGKAPKVIKSKVLAKALKRKDPVVMHAFHQAAQALGLACVSLRHVFDPELFVFGGGLVEACGQHLLPAVQDALDEDPLFKKVSSCEAVPSELGDDAVILGAVALAKRTL